MRPIVEPAKPGEWTIAASPNAPPNARYAQVAVAGRGFDQLQGDQDHNRPFEVRGQFDDAEVISIVSCVRPQAKDPIRLILRNSDDSVAVWTRLGAHESGKWTLRKQGLSWVILSYATLSA